MFRSLLYDSFIEKRKRYLNTIMYIHALIIPKYFNLFVFSQISFSSFSFTLYLDLCNDVNV